jgi:predicted RNase H-like nuclease (RuvC/YqgF family)
VLEHRRLQDDLFLLKYNIKEFDSRYRQLDDRRKLLNIDNSINQDMNDMLVKETVALRKKLAHSEERRLELEDTVNQLRGQVWLRGPLFPSCFICNANFLFAPSRCIFMSHPRR